MSKPARTADRLRVIAEVLALAEERRAVSLAEAERQVGVPAAALRALLEPVLFLEWRDAQGELRSEARAFLLTEDDHLLVTDDHWLRGLASVPPEPPTALRLFVAGVVLQAATAGHPSVALDRVLERLAGIVQAPVVLRVDRPPWLEVCEGARQSCTTLCMRYLSAVGGEPHTFEVEPHLVASRWGNWYMLGRVVDRDGPPDDERDPDAIVTFRIDRIVDARPGDRGFSPEAIDLPEWWDLTAHERTVTAQMTRADLERLPQPNRFTVVRDLGGDRVEAEIVVIGQPRLEHLLLALGPDADVCHPPEYAELRRTLARELLACYGR
jgi:predicted DNA-binding transcriptional regulator YafY